MLFGVVRCCSGLRAIWSGRILGGRGCSGLVRFVRLWSGVVGGSAYLVGAILGVRGWSGLVGFVRCWSGWLGAAAYLVGVILGVRGWSGLVGVVRVCSAVFGGGGLSGRGRWAVARRMEVALAGRLFCCGAATVSRGGMGCGAVAARRAGKSCELVLAGSSGWWRCERSWVWAPDQVGGDGSWGGEVGCCSRRDTPVRARGRLRGKRGYDGVGGGVGMAESWGGGDGGARGDGGEGAGVVV